MSKSNSELLHLATRANRLASQLNEASELQRLLGRLARDPHDSDALLGSVVYEAKSASVFAESLRSGTGLVLLQLAINLASQVCWENLWNDAHPDLFGQAWEGEDFQLLSAWRENVRTMIKECHQEWILAVGDADEYIGKLLEAGSSKEAAEELADWLGNVRCA